MAAAPVAIDSRWLIPLASTRFALRRDETLREVETSRSPSCRLKANPESVTLGVCIGDLEGT
jgi:hypothetical protein